VLVWPDAEAVRGALTRWTAEAVRRRPDVLRIGYFGSYARGDWGVGSDVDVIVVLDRSDLPFERRGVEWDTSALPVPTDILVYTGGEWEAMRASRRFSDVTAREVIWLFSR
jgi:predicted nucleotidyltransferase